MGEETNSAKSVENNTNKIINDTVENKEVSALLAIAVEYNYSDDEEFEEDVIEITSNNVEETKNSEKPEITDYDKNVYRMSKENEKCDSESDDESISSETSDSSVLNTSTDSDTSSDSNSTESNKIDRHKKNTQEKQSNKKELGSELDDLPPIEDLTISVPEVLCDPLGEVAWMVEQLVVVRPKPSKPTLNLDTVLFVDRGKKALGKIFDVFGQVNDPHYCVRFNSSKHILEKEIEVGMTVYYCPNSEYTSLVFAHELLKIKGTDAPADGEAPDFSDDEEERKYYESLEKNKQNEVASVDENVPQKRRRTSTPKSGWQSNHPWNRNAKSQNYKLKSHTSIRNTYSPRYNNPWPHSFNSWQMHPRNPRPNGPNMNSNNYDNYSYGPHHGYYNGNNPQNSNSRIPFGMPPTFYPPIPHSSYQSGMLQSSCGNTYSQPDSSGSNWLMDQLPPPPLPPGAQEFSASVSSPKDKT